MFNLSRSMLGITLLAASLTAFAENYPTKPVTLIVPSVPGGAADAVARLVAEGLGRELGKPVIVENRPGGAAIIGTQAVARAAPDGYTLLLGLDAALVASPYLLAKVPYDAKRDFSVVGTLATLQYVLVASPAATFHSVPELVEQARGCCVGTITYATGGEGSVHHLAMELLQQDARIELKHVPYKAAPQGFTDLMGGHIDLMFIAAGTASGPVKAGKVQALAVSGQSKMDDLPSVPRLSDSVSGYVFESWFGLLAPAKTPPPVLDHLSSALKKFLDTPEARKKMQAIGVHAAPGDAAALHQRIESDTKRYAPVITKIKQAQTQP